MAKALKLSIDNTAPKPLTKLHLLNSIKAGLLEVKKAKKAGKKLETLQSFLKRIMIDYSNTTHHS